MQKPVLFIAGLLSVVFISCTPNAEQPAPATPTKYYLSKVYATMQSGQVYTSEWILGKANEVIYRNPYSYNYDSVTGGPRYMAYVLPPAGRSWTIAYANGLPAGGSKSENSYAGGTGYTIAYTTQNGRITEMLHHSPRGYSVGPFPPTSSTDTTIRASMNYVNDNVSKISVAFKNGFSRVLEYTYGTNKSPLVDQRLKFLFNPEDDEFLSFTNHYIDFFSTNEILSIKMAITKPNGVVTVESATYQYTYNKEGYPLTVKGTLSSGEVFTQVFEYK
ncbi:MAG: hypothetical protein JWM28_3431 [Chitinophagaceae bacterium]|nr:hypothetical protein [Chitinophagaceae bacterium]